MCIRYQVGMKPGSPQLCRSGFHSDPALVTSGPSHSQKAGTSNANAVVSHLQPARLAGQKDVQGISEGYSNSAMQGMSKGKPYFLILSAQPPTPVLQLT